MQKSVYSFGIDLCLRCGNDEIHSYHQSLLNMSFLFTTYIIYLIQISSSIKNSVFWEALVLWSLQQNTQVFPFGIQDNEDMVFKSSSRALKSSWKSLLFIIMMMMMNTEDLILGNITPPSNVELEIKWETGKAIPSTKCALSMGCFKNQE